MKSASTRTALSLLAAVALCLGAATTIIAQNAAPAATRPASAPAATPAAAAPVAPAPVMSAAQLAVWNSPEMLRARAWFADYLAKTPSISPDEAKQMQTELERLTPAQMKLFMVRHEYEYQSQQKQLAAVQQAHVKAAADSAAAIRAQQIWFNTVHKSSLNRAYAQEAAVKHEYADINQDETEAAESEQHQVNVQNADDREAEMNKQQDLNTPGLENGEVSNLYPGSWLPGVGSPIYGGYHYHFHAAR